MTSPPLPFFRDAHAKMAEIRAMHSWRRRLSRVWRRAVAWLRNV